MISNRQKGYNFEELAREYLEKHGFKILEQNKQESHKEIDFICEKNEVIHFVEVKGRTNDNQGEITETLTQGKRKNLLYAAKRWIIRKYKTDEVCWLIDFLGIYSPEGKEPEITFFENEVNEW